MCKLCCAHNYGGNEEVADITKNFMVTIKYVAHA